MSTSADPACSAPAELYEYDKIDASSNIRLLTLQPSGSESQFNSELRISLSVASLAKDSLPEYDALSYACGEPIFDHYVVCDGRSIPITKHLTGALRHLRLVHQPRTLWVDAISINQKDLAERALQIQRMYDIFSGAKQVVAWLGHSTKSTQLAVDTMILISEMHGPIHAGERPVVEALAEFLHNSARIPDYRTACDAIRLLLRNQWFRRLWILQEALSNRNVSFQCGNCVFKLSVVLSFCSRLIRSNFAADFGSSPEDDLIWQAIATLASLRLVRFGEDYVSMTTCDPRKEPIQLYQLVGISGTRKASLPHDRLYALLSISDCAQQPPFPVDYTLDFAEVYTDYAIHVLQSSGSLNILSMCQSDNECPRTANIPSWVPDWTTKATLQTLNFAQATEHFQAGPVNDGDVSRPVSRQKLAIRGIFIDSIHAMTDAYHQTRASAVRDRQELLQFVEFLEVAGKDFYDLYRFVRDNSAFDSLAELWTAFWKTLLIDSSGLLDEHYLGLRVDGDTYKLLISFLAFLDNALQEFRSQFRDCVPSELLVFLDRLRVNPDYDFAKSRDSKELGVVIFNAINRRVAVISQQRNFATTKLNRLGWVPAVARPGDLVSILVGSRFPIILRPKGQDYEVVGESYIHGLMYWDESGLDESSIQDIYLV